jgi:predicted ATPase
MLSALRIKNFKGWRDSGRVDLAPLTLLFGTNSSGKSSLHQFLLLLRQTAESPDRRRVLHPGDDNTPVDLGSYTDLINGHDPTRALGFELEWRSPHELVVVDVRTGTRFAAADLRFQAAIRATDATPPRLYVEQMDYELVSEDGERRSFGLKRDTDASYRITTTGYDAVMRMGRKWPVSAPSHFHGFPDDTQSRFQNLEFVADLTYALDEQLSSLAYLGPLRERPERLYRWSGEEPEAVGWRGERTVEALLAGQSRDYRAKHARKAKALQVLVAEWLRKLGVIDAFSVTPIREGRDEYEVRVRAPARTQEVLLTDVGFGVSQVLPVITQCFYATSGSTLIFEQPEIHLHPAVQSGLADLFIEALIARENGTPRNVQLLVETHSEHLLRRLLRRIAEGAVDPDQVAIYVVDAGRTTSTIEPLEVDDYGNVHNWPPDFFGDQTTDMIEQTRAARRRRSAA